MFGQASPFANMLGQPAQTAPVQPVAQVPQVAQVAPVQPQTAPVASPFGAPQQAPRGPSPQSLFGGVEAARSSEGGNYYRPGHYISLVKALKSGTTRKGKDFVVFEMTIIHVYDNAGGQGHKVGEDVSHMLTKGDSFLGNIKAIFAALAGVKDEQITEAICSRILTENLVNGLVVENFNRNITTKAGKLFTDVRYRRILTPAALLAEGVLTAEEKQRFFPNNALETAAAANKDRP